MEELMEEGVRGSMVEEALARAWAGVGGTPAATRSPDASRAFVGALLDALLGSGGDAAEGADETPVRGSKNMLAEQLALGGQTAAEVARETLGLGRGLEEVLDERGALTNQERRRLRSLVDAAVGEAIEAHAGFAKERRDAWLSFYAHELRNPLNTLVNALWLIRNGDRPAQQTRIFDMADRALTRLEATVKEVREIEQKFPTEPPARAGSKIKP